jgi:parvulin-like peptidyl-prolyl isomerase
VTRSKSAARQRAAEVLEQARQGVDFSQLAREYSDDPGGKLNRGNLGRFKRDAMVKKFSDAAFALEVGEVSAVVETAFGFHIIKRNQ